MLGTGRGAACSASSIQQKIVDAQVFYHTICLHEKFLTFKRNRPKEIAELTNKMSVKLVSDAEKCITPADFFFFTENSQDIFFLRYNFLSYEKRFIQLLLYFNLVS